MNEGRLKEIRNLVKVGPDGRLMGAWDGDPRATALTEALAEILAECDSLEEQVQTYERALIRIRDWDGFRHTGEVRDCAGEALRG